MKVYALVDTSYGMENSIIGIFSTGELADEYALKFCTSVCGELDSDAYLLMDIKEHELDIRFYDVFNPTED